MSIPTLNAMIAEVNSRSLQVAYSKIVSRFTLETQVQDWGGRKWFYEITLSPYDGQSARSLSAFFDSLSGPVGRFLFADPSIQQSVLGSPVVSGSNQTGSSLNVSGLIANSLAFRAGDFFSLGSQGSTRLYRVVADATADPFGIANLKIVPNLRSSPANLSPLEVNSPKVLLRMIGSVPTNISTASIHRFSFSAEEAI